MKSFAFASAVLGASLALVVPATANAAAVTDDEVVSQGNGRLIETSLLDSNILDSVAELRGAEAVNEDASGDVIEDLPLDASVLSDLLALKAGSADLFGDNGIIQLGAVGQYAEANDDATSAAFSGTVTDAPSLIGVGTGAVSPGANVGSPQGDSSAEINVGTSDLLGGADLVNLGVTIGALAASAETDANANNVGEYTLADLHITVGGDVLEGVLSGLEGPLDTLIAAANVAGLNLENPVSNGTIDIDLQDLLAVAGVSDINDLPAGTNLLTYLPEAVVNQVTGLVDGVLDAVQDKVDSMGPILGATLNGALDLARGLLNPILDGITSALAGPLGDAVDGLAQLNVNEQTTHGDGSFTQTALGVGLGPDGSLASVNLANATVGPNMDPEAIPMFNASSAGIAGGLGIIGAATWFLVAWMRRRNPTAAIS